MLHIDGSYGEGGGQIVRTAIALSVLTKTPVQIHHIRAQRPKPGLQAQHYTAISCMKTFCHAKTEGVTLGSSDLTFVPGDIQPGDYTFDIGTAGSMILVFQACILCSLHTTSPITIRLRGGSDVKWAPSWDYFTHVYCSLLRRIGIRIDAQLHRRGYYPNGGGDATITIHPSPALKPLQLGESTRFNKIEGIIHLAGLPDHIATRMNHTVIKTCTSKNFLHSISIEKTTATSEGTGITLWASSPQTIIGATTLGEKGVSAEHIAEHTVQELFKEIDSGVTLDSYAFDQILPYLAFIPSTEKSCVLVRYLSKHAHTNMWLMQHFFPKKFEVRTQQQCSKIII